MSMDLMNGVKKNGAGRIKTMAKLKKAAQEAITEGRDTLKGAAWKAQVAVKRNPWAYIGGAVAGVFLLGFALGKKK